MRPRDIYQQRVSAGLLKDDPAQHAALDAFERLYAELLQQPAPKKSNGFFERFKQIETPDRPKGIYMYGGVGRGKSMLMDLFFDTAPVAQKRRVHFHAFMQEIHHGMHLARQSNTPDALKPVADAVIASARLLCFDEMQISDITDAMIVGRLFQQLFDAGVVVVTTSNRPPDDLYKDGLNRQLFLPFIDLIKDRMQLHNLDSPTDHRQNRLQSHRSYFTPNDEAAEMAMQRVWSDLTGGKSAPLTLHHKGREILLPEYNNGAARASFSDLCGDALGPGDYLKIAETLRVLLLCDIPSLSRENNNEAKRFVTLIDALYEAKVKFIASADAAPEQLYNKGEGAFEFERTASRLREMQSKDWAMSE